MSEILGVLALVGGVLLAIFGYRRGAASERERSRKFAESFERARRAEADRLAAQAVEDAKRRAERDSRRPAADVLTDFARRGGRR